MKSVCSIMLLCMYKITYYQIRIQYIYLLYTCGMTWTFTFYSLPRMSRSRPPSPRPPQSWPCVLVVYLDTHHLWGVCYGGLRIQIEGTNHQRHIPFRTRVPMVRTMKFAQIIMLFNSALAVILLWRLSNVLPGARWHNFRRVELKKCVQENVTNDVLDVHITLAIQREIGGNQQKYIHGMGWGPAAVLSPIQTV